jgi:hypothetical protein
MNIEGKRFMDEGENQFGLTYAKVSIFRSCTV